ncbi:MG2 domain-containing protein [Telmatospirillum sp.]|uniref:alpha-2-macroglobulin n=1 Tax=Telmatospirillum sp. TaxID=2079197 RepID=UPI00284ADC2D|nr:alpha-2-macroglobulin family protein [Telmatospirillum sp.]MDR3439137.1 MG2 domain-containing protein [Telmatospirillum sp.]
MSKIRLVSFVLFLVALLAGSWADAGDSVRRPNGSVLVPEHFLRQWDPVTLFFDRDVGPAKGGAEDHPESFATLSPSHPGAFVWLDGHTLQFRPAVAWPPMGRFTWTVQGRAVGLVTLMSAASSSIPANGTEGLDPVETITLTFRDPIAAETLARLVTIELRPLPGVGGDRSRTLDFHDFDVRALERRQQDAPAAYLLDLHQPVPWGTKAIVHIRLSPDQGQGDEEQRIAFSTAAPFAAVRFGCRDTAYPTTPEGASYARERALLCPPEDRSVVVSFSERLADVGPIEGRNLVRLSPQVEDLKFRAVGNTLVVNGRFEADTLYQLRLEPAALKDVKGRSLAVAAPSQLFLSFPARPGYLRWLKADGIAERFGPQMVPVKARGVERVDLRIHPIDPLDNALWPFPADGVELDDALRPPAPGEEPEPVVNLSGTSSRTIAEHIRAFGSPSFSELVTLPIGKGDVTSTFGLNLRPYLQHMAGAGKPGHYLVGMRRLDADGKRQWMRLQVTDLSLTTIDETDRVRFAVTSLSTGLPVDHAAIRIEGTARGSSQEFASLVTGADGFAEWEAPGRDSEEWRTLQRVVVSKDNDVLVLDTRNPPREYAEGGWRDDQDGRGWLAWTLSDISGRTPPAKDLCHIFTERPIYRPDDPVHIKGYVRRYEAGKIALSKRHGTLVVEGPDGATWRWPFEINEYGSFYHKFDDQTAATGIYKAYLQFSGESGDEDASSDDTGNDSENGTEANTDDSEHPAATSPAHGLHCHVARFKKEAYRLPKFEVSLHTPVTHSLDEPFPVTLTAEYYAGGVVADRPLHWRVTQVPYAWTPKARPGFVFSADQRFSGNQPFRSSPVLEREEKTDEHGAAKLTLDPTIEPTAQPRKYQVEATVVGDDDQTVTNSQEILALPPFVLGVKVARFLEHADRITPEIVVEDGQGKTITGQQVTVRLLRRQWNSILQASDFTQGSAKYVTEVIEDKVAETTFTSGTQAATPSFPINGAGVYLVEVESQDKLGRLQTVKVDLFAGGDRPATWSRPPAEVFSVAPDKTAYAPGETAKLVLQSPFQTGQALAVVEEPNGNNSYAWVPVKNGYGTFPLPVKPEYLPRLAVHFVLMRGRLKGDDDLISPHADLRKPATLAATQWISVTPVKNVVKVDLAYPHKALPGQNIDLTVKLTDDQGKPLAGEVTLWLVDQAVLALAREAKLDPLPQFIVPRFSATTLRDSRNLAFGLLPLQEEPGGDEADDGSPLLRVTVRKNFTPVPYYEPNLHVGPNGIVKVSVALPDSLTNFKIRAKAVSGPARFGVGTGDIQVRLPIIVQPALPRFVRPGDSFDLSAIGRAVEGEGGPGRAQVKLDGLELTGGTEKAVDWQPGKPQRFDFPVKVPTPALGADGKAGRRSVDVTVAVERKADGARDAFEVALPVQPDRDPVVESHISILTPETPVAVAGIGEPVRPGTQEREVLVASPPLVALSRGLDYLRSYPFGCTEQRISQTRADIAGLRFDAALNGRASPDRVTASYKQTQEWIAASLGEDGLVPYWPGAHGYVSLTAWALELITEAKAAGLPVDNGLREKLTQALRQSLRSDYRTFVDGDSLAERIWALTALTAAGQGDSAYAAELARKGMALHLESRAQITWALARAPGTPPSTLADLEKSLWNGIVVKLDQGRDAYGGLQEGWRGNGLLLPSETRTIAQVLRASVAAAPAEPRNRLLSDALLTLGQGDGWGSTNANAEAMLAVTDMLANAQAQTARSVTVSAGGAKQELSLNGGVPLARLPLSTIGDARVSVGQTGEPLAVWVRSRYLPKADGSTVASAAQGFAVDREEVVLASDGSTARRIALDKPAQGVEVKVGEVVEEHVVVVNATDRNHVAVVIPLAAGMEPMNARLATAPPEAQPSQPPSLPPSYVAFLDDKVSYFYDSLPKGTYHFRFRSRATIPGRFIQPAASAHAMYDDAVNGNGNGAFVVVTRP